MNIDEIEITIFDTETTGLEPASGDRIVEIAAVRFKGDKRISVFESLVDPGRPVSEAAFAVNRISSQMLKGAPKSDEVLPKFLDFIKGSCICSYNAVFDLGFLDNELKIIGRQLWEDAVVVDILKMSRRLLPGMERYALWFVADRLGIKAPQQHRALSDVEMTAGVFQKLKEILRRKKIADFGSFSTLFGLNSRAIRDINNQKIAEIQRALDLKANLKIKYLSSSGAEVSEREIIPKEIRQENGRQYLVAHCFLRGEERTFRIDGILHLEFV
jgi:DNA polymerase III epsilon subunit family exonuclease